MEAIGDIRLGLLGGFELLRDGDALELSAAVQRLVAFLALRKKPALRTHVAGVLWMESDDDHASACLRSALWRLSSCCRGLVQASASHLRLNTLVAVDYRQAAAVALRLLDPTSTLAQTDLSDLARAEDVLPDWGDEWLLVEREQFRQLRMHALEASCARLLDAGRIGEAVQAGLAAVACEPLRESAQRVLIRVHLAQGNYAEAKRQYGSYRGLLRKELDLEPTIQMKALMAPIARHSVGGRASTGQLVLERCRTSSGHPASLARVRTSV